MSSESVYTLRARVAGLSRDRLPNDADLLNTKAALTTETLAAHIRKVVAAAPPLNAEQRDTIMAAFAGFDPSRGANV